jgi:hypothetical protein
MITRYDHTENDVMEARLDGEWIRFSDHEAETKDLKELIAVLRGFRPNALCARCRAPTPCSCGYQPIVL